MHSKHNPDDADRYRMAQAQKLLDAFEKHNARPARTIEEAAQWLDHHPDKVPLTAEGKIDPYAPLP